MVILRVAQFFPGSPRQFLVGVACDPVYAARGNI
jgi:hypothetical protein